MINIAQIESNLNTAGLQNRPSQLKMIEDVFQAFKDNKIIVVEAPTGTGKTISYCLASYYAKKEKQTIVISTATIALQEQLYYQDLPLLAQLIATPIRYSLAKGRRRYICHARLFDQESQTDLFDNNENIIKLKKQLQEGSWDGDRDQLKFTIFDEQWQQLSTDTQGCSGKHCSFYQECAFYKARKKMFSADFVIANHSLLLADFALGGGKILSDPSQSIYIIDECHHLPQKALDHFAKSTAVLGSIKWLNLIIKTISKMIQDQLITAHSQQVIQNNIHNLIQALQKIQEYLDYNKNLFQESIWRCPENEANIFDLALPIVQISQQLYSECQEIFEQLTNQLEQNQNDSILREQLSKQVGYFGYLLNRLQNLHESWTLFSQNRQKNEAPIARWFEQYHYRHPQPDEPVNQYICHVSPIHAGQKLKQMFWDQIKHGVLLCSATIRSLGEFHDFRRKVGLNGEPIIEQIIPSIFNYKNSILFIPRMQSEPSGNNPTPHLEESIKLLPELILPKGGTLVLFTSKKAMEITFSKLPQSFSKDILMQGSYNKSIVINTHKEKIRQGQRSILFGLASFGEGLDLPANFCQHVIIHKLPFTVPTTPIELTRSEWLILNKRDPFMLSTLPDTSIRLTQFVGRLIRQESDLGIVTILDKRIISKQYGQSLLENLPGFTRLLNSDCQSLKKLTQVEHLF